MMTHWLKQLRGNRPALGSTAPSTPRRVRGRALRLEALEDRTTPTQLAYGLFDTAVDSTGAILTSGVDANYTITTNPDGSGPAADIITPSYGTGYISPNASGNGASGTYAYTTTFTVPVGTTMAGATITGLISADNNINDIRLDGAATGFAQISGAFDRGYNFGVDIAGLTAGTHTLTFVVQNTANGATGLKVSNLVMNVAPRSDANQPPALTGGGTPTSSLIGGPGVAIDPNLTVTDADGPDLTGAVVAIDANFTAGDVLGFTNQNGITGSYSAGNGVLTLTGSATAATYQTALRSVTIATPTAGAGARDISFSIAQGAYFAQNGHFYEFVSAPSINWGEAEAAASGRNIFGLQGYLATLQSTAENTFAADRAGAALAWLGASDAHAEGVWQHAAGPEAGVQFWQGAAAGGPVNGEYNNWRIGGEPNDAGGEDYAHFLGSAEWNDYNQTTAVAGYIVEYGGSANDPVLSLTSSTTVNAVNRTANPTVTAPGGAISINAAVISVTGTAAANSLVRVYSDANNDGIVNGIDAVVAQQQLTGGATTYSISTPLAPNAANNFVVTATVSPDFESNPVNVPTITEDSNAPTGTVVTGPAAPTSVNAATFAITGTAEANSFVRIYRDVNNNIIDAGDTVVGSQQLVGGATTFGISVPLTQDAANNFLVTATDAAANEGAPVDVPTITEDSLAPALPVVTTPAAAATVNAASALVAGTAEAGSLVRIYNDLNNNGIIDGGDSVVAQQQLGAGVTSFGISTPLTQNPANNFLVTSGDAAGNQSGPTDVPTIAEDSNAPAGPTVAGPSAPTTVNVANFAITGTAEAGSLVRVYSDANNNGVVDGPDAVVGSQQLGAGATSFTILVPLMQDAPNDFTVTATDSANNESAPVNVPTITEDSTAPVGTTVSSPASPTSVNANAFTITGTAEANSFVRVYNDVNNNGVIDAGDLVVSILQLSAGATTFSIPTPLTQDAANDFLVTAADEANNRSAPVDVPTITEDSQAPSVPVVTTPSATATVNAASALVAGTAEAGSLVQVYNDVNNNGVIDAGDTVVASQQLVPGATAFGISTPLTQDTANNFLVTSTDAAGNESAEADVPTITKDSIAPAGTSVTGPPSATTVNVANFVITGTAEAGSLVRVYSDANNNGVVDGPDAVVGSQQLGAGATSFIITVPLMQDAPNDFTVTATDSANNESTAATPSSRRSNSARASRPSASRRR